MGCDYRKETRGGIQTWVFSDGSVVEKVRSYPMQDGFSPTFYVIKIGDKLGALKYQVGAKVQPDQAACLLHATMLAKHGCTLCQR